MKSKLEDIIIDKDNSFANCKLDRAKYAQPLREIVKSYSDGCVLAISSEESSSGRAAISCSYKMFAIAFNMDIKELRNIQG